MGADVSADKRVDMNDAKGLSEPASTAEAVGARSMEVVRHQTGGGSTGDDWLAEEVAVALVFNGISHAVMMATPGHLEDFALGFALSEGLLSDASELYGTEVTHGPQGIAVDLEVAAACEWRLKERRRHMAGRTGCGLCGVDDLAQVRRATPPVPAVSVSLAAVTHAMRVMRAQQTLQQQTGATHAAAWCDAQGQVLCVREDVGRHNALDKLIGAVVRARLPVPEGFVCITSRASFEMVQKAATLGVGVLAAVSAPTALAVDMARECGMVLLGFVRDDTGVAYANAQRVLAQT